MLSIHPFLFGREAACLSRSGAHRRRRLPRSMRYGCLGPPYLLGSPSRRLELARGLTSLPESNRSVGSLNRLVSVLSARSANPLSRRLLGSRRTPTPPSRCSLTRTGRSLGGKRAVVAPRGRG